MEIVNVDEDPIMRKENRHPKSDYLMSLIAHAIGRSALAIAGFLCVSTLRRLWYEPTLRG